MPDPSSRPEGFTGQHLVVLPESVILEMKQDPLLRGLFPTATGSFPVAPGHLVERPEGVGELIVIICLRGRGWVRLEGSNPVSIQAGEVLLIPPGMPHSYGAHAEDPWSIMWVHCRGEEAALFVERLGVSRSAPLLFLPEGGVEQMGLSEIYQQLEQGYTASNLLAAAARLRYFLAECNRLRLPEHPGARSADEGVQKSIQWMNRHLHAKAVLPELAHLAGLSVPHYCAMFRRKIGFAPIDYFLRLKIQRACQLLDTTALRIEEVAAQIGCDDAYYFSRLFKKIIGRSPRDYRKIPKG